MSKKVVTVEQLMENARQAEALTMQVAVAAAASIEEKQDKITGTAGQVVGFDKEGRAVPQEAPSSSAPSLYDQFVAQGYTGTETDFETLIASGPWLSQEGVDYILFNTKNTQMPAYSCIIPIFADEFIPGTGLVQRISGYSFACGYSVQQNASPYATLEIANPIKKSHAATKQYVDDTVSANSKNGLTFLKKQYCMMQDVSSSAMRMGVTFYAYRDGEHGIAIFYHAANIYNSQYISLPEDTNLIFYNPLILSDFINLVPESEPLVQVDVCVGGSNKILGVLSKFDLSTGEFTIEAGNNIDLGTMLTLPGFARFESDQITFK